MQLLLRVFIFRDLMLGDSGIVLPVIEALSNLQLSAEFASDVGVAVPLIVFMRTQS